MPEAETSQFPQPSHNSSPIRYIKKSSDFSEPHEVHRLVVKDDKGRREFPLGGEVYSIGRDPDSNIQLFSLFVSRRHATLVRRQREDGNYRYQIVDGNLQGQVSANGISIDGRKIQVHELKNEDEVVFGAGVTAKYYLIKPEERKVKSSDPFDITLIDPSMIDESDEEKS